MLVGIRSDESTITDLPLSLTFAWRCAADKPHGPRCSPKGHTQYIYPICELETADIWTRFAKTGKPVTLCII